MFAGRQRKSSNIRFIQLFHELKQRFPTVPDHIVSSCINSYVQTNSQDKPSIIEYIESTLAENGNSDQMGRSSIPSQPQLDTVTKDVKADPIEGSATKRETTGELAGSVLPKSPLSIPKSSSVMIDSPDETSSQRMPKRPNRLDIRSECFNDNFKVVSDENKNFEVPLQEKILNIVSEKPPRSPLSCKRFTNKNSTSRSNKTSPELNRKLQDDCPWSKSLSIRDKPTVESKILSPSISKIPDALGAVKRRPRSIHGTLDISSDDNQKWSSENPPRRKSDEMLMKKETCSTPTQTTDTLLGSPNLNLSLNVNVDLHRKSETTQSSRSGLQSPSPRSITSVNLTVTSPTKSSQEKPVSGGVQSITEQQKAANRLQITLIPSGGRVRPRSYHPQESHVKETIPSRTGSLNNLAGSTEPPVILKQKARLERLRSELNNEKSRLERVKQEIYELEKSRYILDLPIDRDYKKQLEREVRHLRSQCKGLEFEDDGFYNNIYTGQQGTLSYGFVTSPPAPPSSPLHSSCLGRQQISNHHQRLQSHRIPPDIEGPKWNCVVCTFLNHPDLDKCEQCEMPRIVHVSASPGDNIHIHVTPRLSRRVTHSWVL